MKINILIAASLLVSLSSFAGNTIVLSSSSANVHSVDAADDLTNMAFVTKSKIAGMCNEKSGKLLDQYTQCTAENQPNIGGHAIAIFVACTGVCSAPDTTKP